jgi:DNA ligase-3
MIFCGIGHDDATLERLQKELLPLMAKVKGDYNLVPPWLRVNRPMVPDFLVKDPRQDLGRQSSFFQILSKK